MADNNSRGDSQNGETGQTLQRIIYAIAGLNLAWGTGEFTLTAFGYSVAGWRNAIVTVACIELLFVWLVMQAKQRRISAWWSVAPLVVTALVQAAKVTGDITTITNPIERVLMVAVAVASVVAIGCVVYLSELRNHGTSPAEQIAQLRGDIQQLQADLAKAMHHNGDVLQRNERLQGDYDALVAQLEQERARHEHELREVARLATAQRAQLTTATAVEDWPQRALQLAQQAIAGGAQPNWTQIGNEVGQSRQNVTKRVKPLLEAQS